MEGSSRLPGFPVFVVILPAFVQPVEILAWLAIRLAHLSPPRPPGLGGTRQSP